MATRKAAGTATTNTATTMIKALDQAATGAAVSAKAFKAAKDVVVFNQGSIEAFTRSSQILATGSQDLLRELARTSKASFDETLAGFRALIAAKTPTEQLVVQMNLVCASTLRALSDTTRLAHAGIELANKAAAPLTASATAAAKAITTIKV